MGTRPADGQDTKAAFGVARLRRLGSAPKGGESRRRLTHGVGGDYTMSDGAPACAERQIDMTLWTGELNYVAVVVAALIPMALGMWWYAPKFGLGDIWLGLVGMTQEEIQESGGSGPAMGLTLIGALVQSYVLALLVKMTGAAGFGEGVILGIWLLVGIVATTSLGVYVFAGRGLRLWAFNNAYHLVGILLMAGLIAAWA